MCRTAIVPIRRRQIPMLSGATGKMAPTAAHDDGGADMGRKPSDDYSPGEPGQYGEPYEMIDEIEGDEDDDD